MIASWLLIHIGIGSTTFMFNSPNSSVSPNSSLHVPACDTTMSSAFTVLSHKPFSFLHTHDTRLILVLKTRHALKISLDGSAWSSCHLQVVDVHPYNRNVIVDLLHIVTHSVVHLLKPSSTNFECNSSLHRRPAWFNPHSDIYSSRARCFVDLTPSSSKYLVASIPFVTLIWMSRSVTYSILTLAFGTSPWRDGPFHRRKSTNMTFTVLRSMIA